MIEVNFGKKVKSSKKAPQRTPRLVESSRTAPPYYFPALIVLQHRYMEFLWFYDTDHYVSLSIPCIYWCWHGCLKKEKKISWWCPEMLANFIYPKIFLCFFLLLQFVMVLIRLNLFFVFRQRSVFSSMRKCFLNIQFNFYTKKLWVLRFF